MLIIYRILLSLIVLSQRLLLLPEPTMVLVLVISTLMMWVALVQSLTSHNALIRGSTIVGILKTLECCANVSV